MVIVAIRILEGLFAVGAIGSPIVIILTTIDDMRLLLSGDDKNPSATGPSRADAETTADMMILHGRSRRTVRECAHAAIWRDDLQDKLEFWFRNGLPGAAQ